MAEPYSSLEVASNEHVGQRPEVVGDSTISAPERNLPNDAPELDKRSWPSQVSLGAYNIATCAEKNHSFLLLQSTHH